MFRGERTLSWMDHNSFMAEGFAEFFKSGYTGNLINSWIPAVDNGSVLKLKEGAKVADVGCGFAFTTLMMAKTFQILLLQDLIFAKNQLKKQMNLQKKRK